ncbi:hypothetical protein PILCRDRAFT_13124 [Piloderma croceum F 1598]|uniref:Uncharacterized protein n=1 Tax=Piloderma croceum (strain F 1598) TaxID=765440 RepID=A0A0C3ETP9_PILCF|nr:hypothetical protein PILCRDRAFT_13124 [Piloderma croceum F 1598]
MTPIILSTTKPGRYNHVDNPDGDCSFFLPVGIRDGSSQGIVSSMQHGSMLAGLSTKEDVVVCLLVP